MPSVSIAAGKLNKRVSVQRLKAQLTPDASGHIDETNDANWQEVAKRWVELLPKGSREFFRGEEVAAEITHQVTMRYDREAAGITTKMRLKMGSRMFHISGPGRNVEEHDVLLVFPAVEIK